LDQTPVALLQRHRIDLLLAPVRSEDQVGRAVIDGGHLVAEYFNDGLLEAGRDLFGVHVEKVTIFEHASTVATKDEDVGATSSGHAAALADGESVAAVD